MKIKFVPIIPKENNFLESPKPSSIYIPEWYKDIPKTVDGSKKSGISPFSSDAPNTTLKSCTPFLDAMSMGYTWSAPVDIEVSKMGDNGSYIFRWRTQSTVVTTHSPEQHMGLPPAYMGEKSVMKWAFHYIIETPPGYSTFFTHPMNRNDLPFRTFSGVVDTDKYPTPVQFPFQLSMPDVEERLIIEEGTPLCQFFPFKREPWDSSVEEMSESEISKRFYDFRKKIVLAYKSRYWSKKYFN